jgi:indolepyruvate ferredoxin oxidoreductase
LGLLASARALRATPLDPFGWWPARRAERALAADYAAMIEPLLPELNAGNLADAVRIAALPEKVRGFGNVKVAGAASMHAQAEELLAARTA